MGQPSQGGMQGSLLSGNPSSMPSGQPGMAGQQQPTFGQAPVNPQPQMYQGQQQQVREQPFNSREYLKRVWLVYIHMYCVAGDID